MLDHVIWWHVYPLGATGAPIRDRGEHPDDAGHRLRELEHWLDYLIELGCNGLLLGPMLGSGNGGTVLGFLCLGLLAMGWLFGPMGALLPELFPTRVRYTGASVSYNLAGILGASAAPYLAQRLAEWGGIGWVGLYLAVADLGTGQIHFDNFEGAWGEQKHLETFVQAYAVEKATIEARKRGHSVFEQSLADGSIKLTIQVGGAA